MDWSKKIMGLRPRNPDELHRFVRVVLGMRVPRRAIVLGSDAPFEYLLRTFFERDGSNDLLVWASRGGGKTMLGAAATLLDLLFKPGIQVCLLGGSFEQSSKMFEYLRQMVDGPLLRPMLFKTPTLREIRLVNGSRVTVLSQSQTSVRGVRVHKLRCDEVELFKTEVWQAAQLVTRGGRCGDVVVEGVVEGLSTMHQPFGLMSRLIERAGDGLTLLRWCALDVVERCPAERVCETCELWDDCQGRAKQADGFVGIDDLVRQRRRSSDDVWKTEMLCERPRCDELVYVRFRLEVHVSEYSMGAGGVVGGMDFGVRNPSVMLWARVVRGGGGVDMGVGAIEDAVVEVFDEYIAKELTLDEHLDRIESRGHGKPEWLGVDPAGNQRNLQTRATDIDLLRKRGYQVRAKSSRLYDGIDRIRRRLDRQTLRIHPRCVSLIKAMQMYHFDTQCPHDATPVKDGPDHMCDALRYLILNLEVGGGRVEVRGY